VQTPDSSSSGSGACPSEDVLAGFAAGSLLKPEREALEAHLARCSVCFEIVSALAAGSNPTPEAPQAAPAQAPLVLARGTAVGRYLLLDRLGTGGMGVVYAAYDPELDRRIALKLLSPDGPHGASSPEGQLRLQREARALARLSHPNVVTVYDVGSVGPQVFVAMELVDGQTLRSWLAGEPRPWQQVVRCFVEAGRGLAAAHAVGLVHRDFKPDNVLVGRDGKVRVTDFGLARTVEPVPEASADSLQGQGQAPRVGGVTSAQAGSARASSLAGAQAGTPRYMAPEQWLGAATGPFTDQFSFCVALWEALHGEPPFEGDSLAALSQAVLEGRLRAAPARRQGVPARIQAALVQGLQREPSARHASMEALLTLLEFDPARRRRRTLALVTAGGLVLGLPVAGAMWRAYNPVELCAGGRERVLAVWGETAREGVRRGLVASGAPGAETTWEVLSRRMEGYTADWASMHREACEATRVRGEQSDDLLGRRMLCLDRALHRVSALARELERADRATAGKALDAAHALPLLRECADAEALLGAPRLPEDPAVRQQVLTLREQISELETLRELGRLKEAIPRAEAVTKAAEALPYRPIQAEALLIEGDLRRVDYQLPSAAEVLRRAALRAEAGRQDAIALEAWIYLLLLDGSDRKELAEARRSLEHAQATLERLGRRDLRLEMKLLGARAGLAYAEGRMAEALALDQERASRVEQELGPDAPALAPALHNLSSSLVTLDRKDEAFAAIQRSLTLHERHWGRDTLNYASALNALAVIERGRKRYPEARAAYEQALGIYARITGERSAYYSQALSNLAILLHFQGEHEAALAHFQRAADIEREVLGADSERFANTLTHMTQAYNKLGRYEESLAAGREALAIRTAKLGPRHVMVASTLDSLGMTLRKLGRRPEALEHFQRAQDIVTASLPEDHAYHIITQAHVGEEQLALGRAAQARASFERAMALDQRRPQPLYKKEEFQFLLAQAAWEIGGPERARAHQRVRELLEKSAEGSLRPELEKWLAAHPSSR
jgi:tetratricopeptide (TPR) repeat protein